MPQVRQDSQCSQPVDDLSPRELAVVTRVTSGVLLKAIGAELEISIQAASTYLARAQRKLRQPSRWRMAVFVRGPLPELPELTARWGIVLSQSERKLGDMLLKGASNADIARAIGRSNKVAARLVGRLLRKLNVGTRWELFDRAVINRDGTSAR
ncbi:MAG TPA: LuxR C-terminal-related transcriptional regulator [Polyangia bacterium]|nr:LuxR C-terminal-related transcriptional regulator [Polyangia bacterium]